MLAPFDPVGCIATTSLNHKATTGVPRPTTAGCCDRDCSPVQEAQFPNLSTGMGGRGGSPLAAGGSGRSRGIRVRAENTSLSCPRLAGTTERALSQTGIEHGA